MKEFFVQYGRLIIDLVLVIGSIVFCVIRKRPIKVVDTLKETVIRLLPYCITQAEASELKGDDKKVLALNLLGEILKEMAYELTPELKKFADEQLEIILSTPQKKGIL